MHINLACSNNNNNIFYLFIRMAYETNERYNNIINNDINYIRFS